MRFHFKDPARVAKTATVVTLLVMMVWGLVSVLFEVRPFWVDEWRIIYNLKFRTMQELWGKLAFMQQFPRAYLSMLKSFTSELDYSYLSLRLPSLVIALAAMLAIYSLANRVYPESGYNRFLVVLMLVSCGTFTEYFVQVKQYTMDLFLCVVAMWQLVQLLEVGRRKTVNKPGYLLLCLSFLSAPFFSYTYPVAVAPVFVVVLVQNIDVWKTTWKQQDKLKAIALQWLPLFICTFSITVFYVVDVAQLVADAEMHAYWGHIMMAHGFDWQAFFGNIFHLLAQAGSGFIFWWLFGILCTIAFLYGIYTCCRNVYFLRTGTENMLLLYSVSLLLLMICLHAAGKFPLGEPRLNAFAVPALSVILVHLLDRMKEHKLPGKVPGILSFVLFAGLIGNICSTIYASFADEKYPRRMATYRATQRAIRQAQSRKIPILITPDVAYPYEKTKNLPFDNTIPGDWVLMTFPAYSVRESLPVYAIDDTTRLTVYLQHLPDGIASVMVGDGTNYRIANVAGQQK